MELSLLGGAPSTLAGNELIAPFGERPNDHRLDYPACRDGCRELGERAGIEVAPRLIRMRLDRGHSDGR